MKLFPVLLLAISMGMAQLPPPDPNMDVSTCTNTCNNDCSADCYRDAAKKYPEDTDMAYQACTYECNNIMMEMSGSGSSPDPAAYDAISACSTECMDVMTTCTTNADPNNIEGSGECMQEMDQCNVKCYAKVAKKYKDNPDIAYQACSTKCNAIMNKGMYSGTSGSGYNPDAQTEVSNCQMMCYPDCNSECYQKVAKKYPDDYMFQYTACSTKCMAEGSGMMMMDPSQTPPPPPPQEAYDELNTCTTGCMDESSGCYSSPDPNDPNACMRQNDECSQGCYEKLAKKYPDNYEFSSQACMLGCNQYQYAPPS